MIRLAGGDRDTVDCDLDYWDFGGGEPAGDHRSSGGHCYPRLPKSSAI